MTFHDFACGEYTVDVYFTKTRPSCYDEPEPEYEYPVAYWNFNEGNGTFAEDSYNRYNGTVVNGTWTSGIEGTSLEFNETGYVQFDTITLDDTWSTSFWVKLNMYQFVASSVFSYTDYPNGGTYNIFISTYPIWLHKLVVSYSHNPYDSGCYSSSNEKDWTNDSWYHVAIIMNNSVATIYINGVNEIDYSFYGSCGMKIETIAGMMYHSYDGEDKYMHNSKGSFDDIIIFDRALSYDEVQYCYQHPGLLLEYFI
jgi:hypothetical protein